MVYSSCVRNCLLHGSETWPVTVRKENELALLRADMRMVRQICGVKLSDKEKGTERQVGIGGCCDSTATQ